jgi:hypothetical protein
MTVNHYKHAIPATLVTIHNRQQSHQTRLETVQRLLNQLNDQNYLRIMATHFAQNFVQHIESLLACSLETTDANLLGQFSEDEIKGLF